MPLLNHLMDSKRHFDIYCVSTAFEDFECNNVSSAKLLLLQGKPVGETRAAAALSLGETSKCMLPKIMPLAHDILTKREEASPELVHMAMEGMKATARIQNNAKANGKKFREGYSEYQLSKLVPEQVLPEQIATFFWTVQAQGTPTWVVHNVQGDVLGTRVGQVGEQELLDWIDEITPGKSG
jgi:hypothetical protein